MGIAVLFVPWIFAALLAVPALRGRAAAAFALIEVAGVLSQLIYRHERQFDHGVAQLWPVRIYVGSGLVLLAGLLVAAYWLLRRTQRRRRLAVGIILTCSTLLPFWFVLAGLTYSS